MWGGGRWERKFAFGVNLPWCMLRSCSAQDYQRPSIRIITVRPLLPTGSEGSHLGDINPARYPAFFPEDAALG